MIKKKDKAPARPLFPHERKTTVVNLKTDAYDVYIGRPSRWGNPFVMITRVSAFGKPLRDQRFFCATRDEAIAKYRAWLRGQPQLVHDAKIELVGKRLGCFCKPLACHGDVLVDAIEGRL